MSCASRSDILRSVVHVDGLVNRHLDLALANAINSAFLEPMKTFSLLAATPPLEPNLETLTLSEADVLSALC